MTVSELMATMTAREFIEWQAFYGMEPFGHDRFDWNFGMVAATMANCHRSKGPAFKPGDFMPDFRPKRKLTPKQARDEFFAWSSLQNQIRGYGPLTNGNPPPGH